MNAILVVITVLVLLVLNALIAITIMMEDFIKKVHMNVSLNVMSIIILILLIQPFLT